MTVTRSKIEWTDSTWSPMTGCTKVSPGCDHCYAETLTERFHGKGSFAEVTLHEDRLNAPLRWRKPRRVFVNSMSDLFHADVPDEFIARVWAVMAATPQHTYQILTKRHGRMRSLLSSETFRDAVTEATLGLTIGEREPANLYPLELRERWWPLRHVWLGVSVEDQRAAELRIPALEAADAALRFLSCEPLIGSVDLTQWTDDHCPWHYTEFGVLCHCGASMRDEVRCNGPQIDWVIAGGESGAKARPAHPDWFRSLRDQCSAAGVPFFFKQFGAWAPVADADDWRNRRTGDHLVRLDGHHWPLSEPHGAEDGTEVLMRRVGKTAAGRVLDGRTWDQYPASQGADDVKR